MSPASARPIYDAETPPQAAREGSK
jgi:hypothetical protein